MKSFWAVLGVMLATSACLTVAMAADAAKGEPVEEAPEPPNGPTADRLSNELGGVLVDRTITMSGKTFYDAFSQLSLDYPMLSAVTLTIHERPSARWGSLIWVTEGTRIHFQTTVSPRLAGIEDIARQAINLVRERVINQKLLDALQDNPDLADDEF